MKFLRMGTACLVINQEGQILLSQRGDLGIWNLPGGRLDRGEYLWDAAAREAKEETGIEVSIDRAVGLYYVTRWHRLSVVFQGQAVGGELYGKTVETRDNRWFKIDELPKDLSRPFIIDDAIQHNGMLRVIETPLKEYRLFRRKFALRWIRNLLEGRPEPRFPRFDIHIVGVIFNDENVAVWQNGQLPRIDPNASSDYALWQWLKNAQTQFRYPVEDMHWAGIWQNKQQNQIEFIFTGRTQAQLTTGQLTGRDALYVQRCREHTPVWWLQEA